MARGTKDGHGGGRGDHSGALRRNQNKDSCDTGPGYGRGGGKGGGRNRKD